MAWAILPVMDGMAKHLSTELPVLEVVWARYFFMVLITLPLTFVFFRQHLSRPKSIQIQLIRSLFLFLSTILFFFLLRISILLKAMFGCPAKERAFFSSISLTA